VNLMEMKKEQLKVLVWDYRLGDLMEMRKEHLKVLVSDN